MGASKEQQVAAAAAEEEAEEENLFAVSAASLRAARLCFRHSLDWSFVDMSSAS